jgi:hypothetical protein
MPWLPRVSVPDAPGRILTEGVAVLKNRIPWTDTAESSVVVTGAAMASALKMTKLLAPGP